MFAYAGGFYYEGTHGITILEYDEKNGRMAVKGRTAPDLNAGCVVARNGMVYATDEVDTVNGAPGGRVVAFRMDRQTGMLSRAAEVRTLGCKPAGIVFDEKSGWMLVAHFSIEFQPCIKVTQEADGSWISQKVFPECLIDLFDIGEDGTPGKLLDVMVVPQASPDFASCVHKVFYSERQDLYSYGNLSGGYIGFFRIDRERARLVPVPGTLDCEPGAGPRHEVFARKLPYLYCNYESKGRVSQFLVTETDRAFVADYSFLPEGYVMNPQQDNQSEILLNREETRLYDVIRGIGMVLVFDVDQETGRLSLMQRASLNTKVPRGATFSPDGRFLCFDGNDNGSVEIWKVLPDGTLRYASHCYGVEKCACITFDEG